MKTVRDLHDEAMRLAQLAFIARERGRFDEATELASRAFRFEEQAAQQVPDGPRAEPTRSILYRSAASLAYQAKELETAIRLVAHGLIGQPPTQVLRELRELYQQICFEMALQERSLVVEDHQIDMRLVGDLIGFGAVMYDTFIERLEALKKLVDKTVQRLLGRDYQSRGRVASKYRVYEPYLQTSPSSFVITLRLARADRAQLPLMFGASDVVGEIMTGMALINESHEEKLRQRIQNDAYYRQFLSLTRGRIAPDGEQVQLVQFSSSRQRVNFTRVRSEIPVPAQSLDQIRPGAAEYVHVTGVLDLAESRRRDVLGLTTDDGHEYLILVDEGLDDLVLSYWKQYVTVSGNRIGNQVHLVDIGAAEQPDDKS